MMINLEKMAADFGVEIKEIAMDHEDSGYIEYIPDDDKFIISVNSKHTERRRRFTLAHELAHFMIHKQHIIDSAGRNVVARSTKGNRDFDYYIERQANGYAAELLMPKSEVERRWTTMSPHHSYEDAIKIMVDDFSVSGSAIVWRLKNLGLM